MTPPKTCHNCGLPNISKRQEIEQENSLFFGVTILKFAYVCLDCGFVHIFTNKSTLNKLRKKAQ